MSQKIQTSEEESVFFGDMLIISSQLVLAILGNLSSIVIPLVWAFA